ncbi:MAG: hypothetical protein HY582_05350 [Candidatus Omnitrophica bacterium]|nr:hypothetical protein [Candidatus Omnitrophota bacterium]
MRHQRWMIGCFNVLFFSSVFLFNIALAEKSLENETTEEPIVQPTEIKSGELANNFEKEKTERRKTFLNELRTEAEEFRKKLDSTKDEKEREKLIEEFRKSRSQKVEALMKSEKEMQPGAPVAPAPSEAEKNESSQGS